MKNLHNFRDFSINEYYGGDFSGLGKVRSTKLGQRLEDIRSRMKRDIDFDSRYGSASSKYDILDSPGKLTKNIFAGLAGAASEVAEIFSLNKGDRGELKDKSRGKKITQDEVIDLWSDKLGPTTTMKDLENFARKSEGVALKRYGKEWDYNNPKGEDQKKFADMIRRGEEEIAKRMKK
jgi:hypothetical protein